MTSRLEVEALDHLGYHVKQLRKPLRRLQRDAYATVEEIENADQPRRVKRSQEKGKNPARARRVTAGTREKT